jgi:hypothetical protein
MVKVSVARVLDVASMKGDVVGVEEGFARASEVPVKMEAVIVWGVVSVHGSYLGQSSEYFGVIR